jgi:hypothetical protein
MTVKRPKKPAKCDLYIPGHCTHPMQARKASETRSTTGTLIGVNNGVIAVEYLDKENHFRNHDCEELTEIAQPGTKVRVYEGFRLLGVDLERGSWRSFSVAFADDPWTACSYEPLTSVTPESLAERLASRGGFTVSGRLLEGFINE